MQLCNVKSDSWYLDGQWKHMELNHDGAWNMYNMINVDILINLYYQPQHK